MLNSPEAQFAIDVVRQAAGMARQIQREMVTPALTKEDRSPVTVADFAVQAVIGHLLSKAYPTDPLVGEEDSGPLRGPDGRQALAKVTQFVARLIPNAEGAAVCDWIDQGGSESADRFWTLDPIDGTKGFLRKEQYAVCLALVVDGTVQVGVLGCPNLPITCRPDMGNGVILAAERGQGSWLIRERSQEEMIEPRRLKVSGRDNPTAARLLRSVESGHTNVGKIGDLVKALDSEAPPVCLDSQAKYAVLAAGEAELLFRLISASRPDYREKIWDQAAGSIVVEEAGGRVSDLDGKALDFTGGRTLASNRGIVASNGRLHEIALEALRTAGA